MRCIMYDPSSILLEIGTGVRSPQRARERTCAVINQNVYSLGIPILIFPHTQVRLVIDSHHSMQLQYQHVVR